MFPWLMIFLGASLLIFLFVALVMFLDAASRDTREVAERQKTARRWRPPFARGSELLSWARDTSAQVVGKWLASKRSATITASLTEELHSGATQAMLPLAPEYKARRVVACPAEGQGMIGVTAPEAIEIGQYIQRHFSRGERNRIYDLAQENAEKIAGQDHVHYCASETACPLQGRDGVCQVYAARPLCCRPLHVAMISKQLGLETSGSDFQIPPWASHIQTIEEGVSAGMVDALESAGLDANVYELNSALAAVMETPDALGRWMQGDDVFAECQVYH